MAKANSVLIEADRVAMLQSLILSARKNLYGRTQPYNYCHKGMLAHFKSRFPRVYNRDQLRIAHYVITYSEPNPDLVKSHAGRQKWRQHRYEMLEWLEMSIEDTGDQRER